MAQVEANFELGINGGNIATTDPPSLNRFDATIFAGSLTYDTTHVAHGNFAMQSDGKNIGWNSTSLGTMTDHFGRIYIWKSGSGEFCRVLSGGINGSQAATLSLSANGFLLSGSSNTTIITGSVDLRSRWTRIEYHIIHSATVGQIIIRTFNYDAVTPLESLTSAATANTLVSADTIRYGAVAWYDDIVANASDFPGPAASAGIAGRTNVATNSSVSW